MSSIAIAAGVLVAILVVAGGLFAVHLLGGWSEVRIRYKLWSWRNRRDTVDDYILGIAGELPDVTVEDAYQELDGSYPGTLEAKREQLLAERDYLQARIDALERDRQ